MELELMATPAARGDSQPTNAASSGGVVGTSFTGVGSQPLLNVEAADTDASRGGNEDPGSKRSSKDSLPSMNRTQGNAEDDSWGTARPRPGEARTLSLPRVYELWGTRFGGRNRFFCQGHCITGPSIDIGFCSCAWTSILAPSVFYMLVCRKFLWEEVHPVLPLFTGALMAVTILLLLLTSCTDPGIIPRSVLQLAVPNMPLEVMGAAGTPPLCLDASSTPLCMITEEQAGLGFRWCHTCKVVRPPRASHCRDCDNCVLRFDHHCPFVNNCVAQRNYTFFSAFLLSTCLLGIAVFSGIALWWSHVPPSGETVKWILILVGAPTGLLLLGVVIMTLGHTYLSVTGRTTKEVLTGRSQASPMASTRTLLAPRGPSLIRARQRVALDHIVV